MTRNGRETVPSPADDPVIRISGVRKSFGRQTVLDGIDLDLGRGETMTVLGRSGTGEGD